MLRNGNVSNICVMYEMKRSDMLYPIRLVATVSKSCSSKENRKASIQDRKYKSHEPLVRVIK